MGNYLIKNVNVFDGCQFVGVKNIAIQGKYITDEVAEDVIEIDGTGKTLLPGLWESHGHVYDRPDFLEKSLRYGNTTLCDMGCREKETVDKMKQANIINVLSAYAPLCAPTSVMPARMKYPDWVCMQSPEEAKEYVRKMVSWGADYIKIIIEERSGVPFPLEIGRAIVEEAHSLGKKVISHATEEPSFRKAAEIGVDAITHMPMGGGMSDDIIQSVALQKQVLAPTITMMEAIAKKVKKFRPDLNVSKEVAEAILRKFLDAGVEILVSTDANEDDPCPPASIEYGKGLLDEIMLMQECGLETEDILARTTSIPAAFFNQTSRGTIAPGKIADLLLVEGNPQLRLEDIRNTVAVWFEGEKKI